MRVDYPMNYRREITSNWQALLAASLGLAAGTISNYINNLFSPGLIAEFGWEKSNFALIGLTVVVAAVCLPIAGRLADRVGTKRMATVGVVGLPLVFIALSMMTGQFWLFFLLSLLQMLIVSCLAGAVVYTRLIAQKFDRARGLALGIASCAPPLASAACSPLLSSFIAEHGWRAGYLCLALLTAIAGGLALWLIPADADRRVAAHVTAHARTRSYGTILKIPAFQIIFAAMLLCNLHFTIQTTQLKVIVMERGISSEVGSLMISLFAIGVIVGRISCGLALDRFPAYVIAVVSFAIPSAGLALLAGNVSDSVFIGMAILSLGLSMGAEGDLAVYLAAKYFRQDVFSTVLGLFTGAMAVSALLGALLLSFILKQTGSYAVFLGVAAASMLLGSLSFLFLAKQPASGQMDDNDVGRQELEREAPGVEAA